MFIYLKYIGLKGTDSSYPEGNFGGNQLLDCSMSLSPLYSGQEVTICTSVPHNASFHQVFTWLHHVRAKFTIFRVTAEMFNNSTNLFIYKIYKK